MGGWVEGRRWATSTHLLMHPTESPPPPTPQTLTDPDQRATYDALVGFSVESVNPFYDKGFDRDQVFVDEVSCIGGWSLWWLEAGWISFSGVCGAGGWGGGEPCVGGRSLNPLPLFPLQAAASA